MAVLFDVGKPRPTTRDDKVHQAAMTEMVKQVVQWLIQGGDKDPWSQESEIREQLTESLRGRRDGYGAARELERYHYWSADTELVEILDGWFGMQASAEYKAVKEWVRDYSIQPQFEVGTRVTALWGNEQITGVICNINKDTAQYTLTPDMPIKSGGKPIVNYEATEAIQ